MAVNDDRQPFTSEPLLGKIIAAWPATALLGQETAQTPHPPRRHGAPPHGGHTRQGLASRQVKATRQPVTHPVSVSKHQLNIPYYNTDHHPCTPCRWRPADAVGMVRRASQSPAQNWEGSGLLHVKLEMAPHTWNFILILDSLAHPNTCWASGILGLDRSHI